MKTIERVVLLALLRDMRAAGYEPVAVWNGYEYWRTTTTGKLFGTPASTTPNTLDNSLSDAQALRLIRESDSIPTLHFTRKNSREWGDRGVLVVLGNGTDCISDYHACDEFDRIIGPICKRLEAGELP